MPHWIGKDVLSASSGEERHWIGEKLFASGTRNWVSGSSERMALLLEIQDTVLSRFGDLDIDPSQVLLCPVKGQVYLAPHYNWGPVASNWGLKVLNATRHDHPVQRFKELTADGPVIPPGIGGKNTCFQYHGYTYANVYDSFEAPSFEPFDLANPSLLFFKPNGLLAGCGYFRDTISPRLTFMSEIMPLYDEVFIHVAGKHKDDGSFKPETGEAHKDHGRHHPNMWDLHIWFNVDSQGRAQGFPFVGMTSRAADLPAPPNAPLEGGELVVDQPFCSDGLSSDGLYRPRVPEDGP